MANPSTTLRITCLLLLLAATTLRAQVTTRSLPGDNASLNRFGALGLQAGTTRLTLAPPDVARLKSEDLATQKSGRPLRVGVQQTTDVNVLTAGTVIERDGYRIYQYEVTVAGAIALSAVFDRLYLPDGARLFVYNAEQTTLVGPITSQQNITDNTFTTGHVTGERLIIELQEPLAVAGQSQVHLSGVVNYYLPRGPFGGLQSAQSCENNMACYPAYQTEGEGVAAILLTDGTNYYLCTGATVNDARQSFRSFFLTAFHCIDFDGSRTINAAEQNSTANWVFYFKYQSATCTPTVDDNVYVTINGATYRAGSGASDFTLLELNAQAPQAENLSFVGWDRSSTLPTSTFGIHHPNGSLKKISFGGATTTVGVNLNNGAYGVGAGTSYLQLVWNSGVTEGGSSGSPLFDGTGRRVVGQLLGGGSFCTSQSSPDQYGRLFTSWTGGGTSSTRLSDWLDPTGISGNTTNLAVPTVSGPAAVVGSGTFGLNTGVSPIVSWSVTNGAGKVSPTSGTGNSATLSVLAAATNLTIVFTVNAGQTYPIKFTKTFSVTPGPLPVTLLSFGGRMTNAGAVLGWTTAREDNNAHFQIERGRDATAFESIATIPTQAPDGTSITPLTYAFTDAQPWPGINYYRLTQTDRDGSKTRHNIIALNLENQPPVLFPNPTSASGEAVIEPAIAHRGYQLTDALGRVLQQTDAPGVLSRVSLSGLPAGVYLLQVQTDSGTTVLRVLR
jgi:Trypsin-like peptidase domain